MLPYRLSICGLDEIGGYSLRRVTHALSILDPDWPDPVDFQSFDDCRRDVFRFQDVIDQGEDLLAPDAADIRRILAIGEQLQQGGVDHFLVHCHAGISRSTAAAVILLSQFHPGQEAAAFEALANLRPRNWPNSRMIELADDLLGRDGQLIAALRVHHGQMIEEWPDLADSIRTGSRTREFVLAERGCRRRDGPRGDR